MMFFFVVRYFYFRAMRNRRNCSEYVNAHPQIVKYVYAMKPLFDDNAVTGLGEIHSRCEIELSSFGVNKPDPKKGTLLSFFHRIIFFACIVPVSWYPLGAEVDVERAKSHPTTPPNIERGCKSKPILSFILDTAV